MILNQINELGLLEAGGRGGKFPTQKCDLKCEKKIFGNNCLGNNQL